MPAPTTPQRRKTAPKASVSPKPKTTQNDRSKFPRPSVENEERNDGDSKPSEMYSGTNLRDKVLKWQSLGDFVSSPSKPNNEVEVKIEETTQDDTKGEAERPSEREQWEQLKEQILKDVQKSTFKDDEGKPVITSSPNHTLEEDIRFANTPRKRVVSDEHWKIDRRTPEQGTKSPVNTAETPIPIKLCDPLSVRPESGSGDASVRAETSQCKPVTGPSPDLQNGGTARKSAAKTHRDELSSQEKWIVELAEFCTPRVLLTKTVDHRKREEKTSGTKEHDLCANEERVDQQNTHTTSDDANVPGNILRMRSQKPNQSVPRKPNTPFVLHNSTGDQRQLEQRKLPARQNPIAKSPEIDHLKSMEDREMKSASAPPIFGTRIENWLAHAPDPYIENRERLSANVRAPPSLLESVSSEPQHNIGGNTESQDDTSPRYWSHPPGLKSAKKLRRSTSGAYDADCNSKTLRTPPVREDLNTAAAGRDEESSSPASHSLKRCGAQRNLQSPHKKSSPYMHSLPKEDGCLINESSFSDLDPNGSATYLQQHKPGAIIRRPVPTKGIRLSTIASMDTFQPVESRLVDIPYISEQNTNQFPRHVDEAKESSIGKIAATQQPSLKRKLTSHADLLSVLSVPDHDNRSLESARSTRTTRSWAGATTMQELMDKLKADEAKYLDELQTTVDGVIPVLLSCVFSKSPSVAPAELFGPFTKQESITTPIVSMGIALERLKSVHKRIPAYNVEAFLSWAQSAVEVYRDYLKAWRMGFQDVVINLAPPDEVEPLPQASLNRDARGHVSKVTSDQSVSRDGEVVDVSFLLKRPLVHLRYLAKTINTIHHLEKSEQAGTLVKSYQDLVVIARRRQNEERARLEDEAAAAIDSTRARDPQTLAPLAGVWIEPNRSVRARDYFDMKLQHHTGQRIDCRTELLLRDNNLGDGSDGDVLLCEVDSASRWLLFPPIPHHCISAVRGDAMGEIMVRIQGRLASQDSQEIITLRAADDQIVDEWLHMLASVANLPQNLFTEDDKRYTDQSPERSALVLPHSVADPRQVEIPIGEQASEVSRRWHPVPSNQDSVGLPPRQASSALHDKAAKLQRAQRSRTEDFSDWTTSELLDENVYLTDSSRSLKQPAQHSASTPTSPNVNTAPSGKFSGLFRNRKSKSSGDAKDKPSVLQSPPRELRHAQGKSAWDFSQVDQGAAIITRPEVKHQRPRVQRRPYSVPPNEMPLDPSVGPSDNDRRADNISGQKSMAESVSITIPRKDIPDKSQSQARTISGLLSPKTQARSSPPIPLQSNSRHLRSRSISHLNSASPLSNTHRRSSSPLKYEYEPSTASDSSGDAIVPSEDSVSVTSESSTDEFAPYYPSLNELNLDQQVLRPFPLYSATNPDSRSPSKSAPQAQSQVVLAQTGVPSKMIASIFCWSERGVWESLHQNECSVIVSPGLIEAYELNAAHSAFQNVSSQLEPNACPPAQPLIAVELTPLVPLRRGTAIDISIRSPPTPGSLIRASNNIMFRSRNNQECEALYNMINYARINNPTYVALQNARAPIRASIWEGNTDRRAAARTHWWRIGSKRSSYRAGSTRRTDSIMPTENSAVTKSSALAALRRFSGGSKMFNVAKSTITSGRGGGSRSSATVSSSPPSRSGSNSPAVTNSVRATSLGINNAKIRLYERETAAKWRDMGSARLTIMHPPRPAGATGPLLTPQGALRQEKRIIIAGKNQGQTLLDVTLGETCFERVARTGIAVSVWEQLLGPNGEVGQVGKTGGVGGAKVRVYMLQFKSEAETAYSFSLVGRLRY